LSEFASPEEAFRDAENVAVKNLVGLYNSAEPKSPLTEYSVDNDEEWHARSPVLGHVLKEYGGSVIDVQVQEVPSDFAEDINFGTGKPGAYAPNSTLLVARLTLNSSLTGESNMSFAELLRLRVAGFQSANRYSTDLFYRRLSLSWGDESDYAGESVKSAARGLEIEARNRRGAIRTQVRN